MKREHVFFIVTLLLTFLSFYLFYQILFPFLGPLIWAILLTIVFYPLFQKLNHLLKKKKVLSAVVMTLLVILIIVLPSVLLMISLANEVVNAYQNLEEMIKTGRLQAYLEQIREISPFKWIWAKLDHYLNLSQIDPFNFLLKNLKQISTFLFDQTSLIFKGLSTFLIGFLFVLLSLFYLFKDGNRLLERLKEIVPIPPRERDLILLRFKEMVYATIYGGIVVASVLGGIQAFGLIGLVAGPLIATLCLTLIEIYAEGIQS